MDLRNIQGQISDLFGMFVALLAVIGLIAGLASGDGSSSNSGSDQPAITVAAPKPSAQPTKPAPRQTAGMRYQEVKRNSRGWEFLNDGGVVQPGFQYTVVRANGSRNTCSFGWMVRQQGTNRVFNLTAGHCGEKGDQVYIRVKGQQQLKYVGTFVFSTGTPKKFGVDPDYALIEVTKSTAPINPKLPVKGATVVNNVASLEQIDRSEPYMCRLGYRSGISCGYYIGRVGNFVYQYRNISDGGDSGGPIWTVDAQGNPQYAAGVHSFGQPNTATRAGAAAIAPILQSMKQDRLYLWGG